MVVKLLDFYADWCGPCKTQDPILEEFVEETGIELEKIDIDDNQTRAGEYDVRSIPTLIMIDENGEEVDRFIGVTQKDTLVDAL